MHYFKLTALALALAALASTAPVPDRAVVEGAETLDPDLRPYLKEKRDRAVVEGAETLNPDCGPYKEKRGVYSKYENNGPYVPVSDEMDSSSTEQLQERVC